MGSSPKFGRCPRIPAPDGADFANPDRFVVRRRHLAAARWTCGTVAGTLEYPEYNSIL